MEVSLDPPGALAPADTPQMVLVTFDDAVVPAVHDLVQSMTTNRCNPNGSASLSQGAGAMIWPYTLDHGVQQNTWTGERPYETFAGLFEVPLWSQMNDLGAAAATMDPPGSDAEALALLQFNFTARYNGNRAPLGVFLHGGQWTSRAAVLGQFIDWARAHSNVWFVSVRNATDYIRNPCGIAGSAAFPPFVTQIRSPWPADDLPTKSFSKGTVRSCCESPPMYPAPDTVYFECTPLPGGTAGMVSTGLWTTGFNATLCLTNDTSESASEWDDSAFGYVVEESVDGLNHWTPLETVRGRTCWSPPIGPSGPPRAYRLRVTD